MVGVVVVSHSAKVAEGTCEIARQMGKAGQKVIAAGGTADGGIGTDAVKIAAAIAAADTGDGVVVLVDLGSAVLSTQTAIELLEPELRQRVTIADAPLVEGTIVAVIEASLSASLSQVATGAADAKHMPKGG